MFDLFLECMPEYNIDKTDSDGNTPLLLAYIKVNEVKICSVLKKMYLPILGKRRCMSVSGQEGCNSWYTEQGV